MFKIPTSKDIAIIAIEYANVYGEDYANLQIKIDFPHMNSEAVAEEIEYMLENGV
jgi:hypothetical protein